MPHLVAMSSEERVLGGSLALSGVTYLLFPFFTDPWILGSIAFVLGLGLGCGQPLSMMLTYMRAPPGRSGVALGLRLTVNHFSHVVVPLVFGAIGTAFGLAPVFWLNAAFLAGGGFLTRRRG
jgi:MFS family permease